MPGPTGEDWPLPDANAATADGREGNLLLASDKVLGQLSTLRL